jgi:polysaccharide transporter, PST family
MIETENKKRLISNFTSLMSLQSVNYILPLLTFPYLVQILGVEYFGLLAFATAIITYFKMLTDYGFDLSATREISKYRNDKEKVIEIFSSVMILKSIFFILSFLLLTLVVFSFDKLSADWGIYFFTFGMVFGQILFPVWFFQGVEDMKYITYLQILAKGIFTVLIFVVVTQKEDYYLVPLINSIGFLIAGVVSLYVVFSKYSMSFKWQSIEKLKYYFKDSYHIFISSIASNIYSSGTIIILGLVASKEIVGYYSMAEKLSSAFSGIAQPLSKTIFPYISNKSKEYRQIFFKKFIGFIALINIFMFGILFYFSSEILELIFNISNDTANIIFKILIISAYFTFLNINLTPFIYANKQDKFLSKLLIYLGILFIPICYLFSRHYLAIGTSVSILIVEIIISYILINKIRRI